MKENNRILKKRGEVGLGESGPTRCRNTLLTKTTHVTQSSIVNWQTLLRCLFLPSRNKFEVRCDGQDGAQSREGGNVQNWGHLHRRKEIPLSAIYSLQCGAWPLPRGVLVYNSINQQRSCPRVLFLQRQEMLNPGKTPEGESLGRQTRCRWHLLTAALFPWPACPWCSLKGPCVISRTSFSLEFPEPD